MKSGKIKDYQITASSSYDEAQPSKARESKYRAHEQNNNNHTVLYTEAILDVTMLNNFSFSIVFLHCISHDAFKCSPCS